jgi:hypothetical protein
VLTAYLMGGRPLQRQTALDLATTLIELELKKVSGHCESPPGCNVSPQTHLPSLPLPLPLPLPLLPLPVPLPPPLPLLLLPLPPPLPLLPLLPLPLLVLVLQLLVLLTKHQATGPPSAGWRGHPGAQRGTRSGAPLVLGRKDCTFYIRRMPKKGIR